MVRGADRRDNNDRQHRKHMTQNINVSELTAAQLKAIKAQLKAQAKANGAQLEQRRAIIDRMLQETDDSGFKHTTSDILAALQSAGLVEAAPSKEDRAEWLKKIQTRKQDLERKPEYAGKVGYKASAHGFTLTPDRIVDWLMDEANTSKLTAADRKAIIKAMQS
jgi:predicted transcriptional regulator